MGGRIKIHPKIDVIKKGQVHLILKKENRKVEGRGMVEGLLGSVVYRGILGWKGMPSTVKTFFTERRLKAIQNRGQLVSGRGDKRLHWQYNVV